MRRTSLTAEEIGEYSGSVKEIRPVTIATYQVMTTRRKGVYSHLELLDARDWGLIVYDEVHLLPAPIFRMTADLQARRRLGLTATLVREDGREGDVFSLIGPKRYDAPWKDIETQGWIAPADCVEVRVTLPSAERMVYAVAEPEERYRLASSTHPRSTSYDGWSSSTRPADAGDRAVPRPARPARGGPRRAADHRRDGGQGAAAAVRGVPRRRGQAAGGQQGRELLDRPADAEVAIQVSGTFGSRQEEAQRLGRMLRPKSEGRRRTSTRSSVATPSTPTSPPTGSGSWPSRATPTRSATPRTDARDPRRAVRGRHVRAGRAESLSEPVARGELGQVRRLVTDLGTWAVKESLEEFADDEVAAVERSSAFHLACWEAGIPTPEPQRAGGRFVADVGGELLRAYRWVEIADADPWLDPEAVGSLLAALHAVRRPAEGEVDEWFQAPLGQREWRAVLKAARGAGAPYADRLAEVLPRLLEVETILHRWTGCRPATSTCGPTTCAGPARVDSASSTSTTPGLPTPAARWRWWSSSSVGAMGSVSAGCTPRTATRAVPGTSPAARTSR